jgi:hypothetical protein
MAILDTKTQGIKEGGDHYISESWAPQLAAYQEGVMQKYSLIEKPRCINLVVNSTTPAPVIPIEWTSGELEDGYQLMTIAAWLFSKSTSHWPCGVWSLEYKK